MSALRIGQFTDSYPPIINGVSTVVAEHHAELLNRQADAHVFTFGYLKHHDDQAHIWRSFAVPMGTSQFRTWPSLDRRSLKAAASMEVLHLHEAVGIGQLGRKLAGQRQIPYVFTNHTRHDLYVRNYPRLLQPFMLAYVTRFMVQLMRGSALTTVPSHAALYWLQSLAPDAADRLRVVRNGIRLEAFERPPDRALRAALGIPADRTLFVYVGRVTPEKNLLAFAEALILAIDHGANAHWLVIGDGQSSAGLAAKVAPVQSRVSLLGAKPRAQIPAYLAVADVFATASLSEVNPVSVIEALACGKPYLGLQAAWWDEFSDEADPEPAGILTRDDRRELAAAIERLCADRTLRERLGGRAKCLSRRFDIRFVTAQWLEIYREIRQGDKMKG